MERVMRFLAIVLVSMITSSCAMEVKKSDLIGQCMMLKDSVSIWHAYDNLYVGKFLLAKKQPTRLLRSSKPFGNITANSKIELTEILKGSNGSYGDFLRVRVRLLTGNYVGLVVDIPACVPYHPSKKWVVNCSLEPNKLSFNKSILIDC